MLLVIIGLVAASIITMFPAPMTARVELRKRLAQTLRSIGGMYSILASQILIPETATMASTEEQAKGLRRLALELQRQIADERSFLQLSTYEPPLRGQFPKENYISVLQHVSTMADLVYLMVSEMIGLLRCILCGLRCNHGNLRALPPMKCKLMSGNKLQKQWLNTEEIM